MPTPCECPGCPDGTPAYPGQYKVVVPSGGNGTCANCSGLSGTHILNYASNQWLTLTRYLEDGRLTIDNAPAEQAIRPLAVGRRNWLQIAGDGGLKSAAVLLSVAATAKRHRVNPWIYVKQLLTESAARKPDADFSDLLPNAWAQAHADPPPAANGSPRRPRSSSP